MRTTVIPSLLLLACSAVIAQDVDLRPTLPELVRAHSPNPVFQSRTRELFIEPIEQIVPKADLVVHGIVRDAATRLSPDQKDLYTDYVISLKRIVLQRNSATASRPGQLGADIVVSRWGGTTLIDGVSVTQIDYDAPAFQVGQEVMLLLTRKNGKYELSSPVAGLYAVEGIRVTALRRAGSAHNAGDKMVGKTVADFEAEVHRLAR